MTGPLDGRVAIVTGGGGGLGEGICSALTNAGAAVAVVDRDRAEAERVSGIAGADGARAISVEADVSDDASVKAMVDHVAGELGGIDIVVNNAAIYPLRPWLEIEEEEWDRVMAVNLKGYFLCARAAYPSMKERGRGRVINVASITFFIGWAGFLDYVVVQGRGRRLHADARPGGRPRRRYRQRHLPRRVPHRRGEGSSRSRSPQPPHPRAAMPQAPGHPRGRRQPGRLPRRRRRLVHHRPDRPDRRRLGHALRLGDAGHSHERRWGRERLGLGQSAVVTERRSASGRERSEKRNGTWRTAWN